MIKKSDLLKMLHNKYIKFNKYEHEAFYTVEDNQDKNSK